MLSISSRFHSQDVPVTLTLDMRTVSHNGEQDPGLPRGGGESYPTHFSVTVFHLRVPDNCVSTL